ncbi:Calcineurin-like phosphoesterase superfamily domain protein [Thalassoglobus neptunius]|uniref:Calcineurin-like phosphoesterase superfamily domain protein n=1 Tax=Thalassoglobus neptunius TaxID=1938619 RepID=A0A5C5V0V6_9PLAN|nr:metallophosphoesterase [Thalassoglobus neptunius]TWT32166.1 Calcineurin-like phosphoesterase superfamily domain protein [Thalassoglobus neptunius]
MNNDHPSVCLGRRAFLKHGTLVLTTASLRPQLLIADEKAPPLRVGLITDLHYADKAPAGTRHYRETLPKLEEAGQKFTQNQPSFLVELGDLIDAADSVAVEQNYLKTINRKFSAISKDRHYVLGNHCVDTLKKEEFLAGVEQEKSYYSFERGGVHFVLLDSCFRSDGEPYGRKNFQWTDANIPAAELELLESDLKATDRPVVVFAHQRLDVNNNHGVKNNAEVRQVLAGSGNVLAVFQGHSHKNDLKEIDGIHYCTLVAMVEGEGIENNGYSLLDIEPNGTIRLTGFRKQKSYEWDHQG